MLHHLAQRRKNLNRNNHQSILINQNSTTTSDYKNCQSCTSHIGVTNVPINYTKPTKIKGFERIERFGGTGRIEKIEKFEGIGRITRRGRGGKLIQTDRTNKNSHTVRHERFDNRGKLNQTHNVGHNVGQNVKYNSIKTQVPKINTSNVLNKHSYINTSNLSQPATSSLQSSNSSQPATSSLQSSNLLQQETSSNSLQSATSSNSSQLENVSTLKLNTTSTAPSLNVLQSLNTISLDVDCLEIQSKITLDNDDYIFGLTVSIDHDNYLNSLLQFTGIITVNDYTIESPISDTGENLTAVYNVVSDIVPNDNGIIMEMYQLWYYNGSRQNYQYAQMLLDSNNYNITLSNFVGDISFTSETSQKIQTLNEFEGSYFLAKFKKATSIVNHDIIGVASWYLQITAYGNQNIQFTLDSDDNIYLVGTYEGSLKIGTASITSALANDMFIAKVSNIGEVEWIYSSGVGSSGFIRGESITYNNNTITATGQYDESFTLDGNIVENNNLQYNIWVANFSLDGDINWLISPNTNDPNEFNNIMASQIVTGTDGYYYITGNMIGSFIFDVEYDVGDIPSFYILKLSPDGNWIWFNYGIVEIPDGSSWYPHISQRDNLVYINLFGQGAVHYNGELEPVNGSGSLDNIINAVSTIDGTWKCGTHIAGSISNPSINNAIYPTSFVIENPYIVIGTHSVNTMTVDSYIIRI